MHSKYNYIILVKVNLEQTHPKITPRSELCGCLMQRPQELEAFQDAKQNLANTLAEAFTFLKPCRSMESVAGVVKYFS